MNPGLFLYPKQALFGRSLPKNKIYEKTRVSASLKRKFVEQVDKIVWQYKLSPETVNIPAKKYVSEIEIFSIFLRVPEIHTDILKCIDNAIPFPIIYELVFKDRVRAKAAFKRASEADSGKWVTDIYFETDWSDATSRREALPVALDLASLYEQLLRKLMPISRFDGEDIRDQVQRLAEIQSLRSQVTKIESQINKEKQFNRKIEHNRILREVRGKIAALEHYVN